MATTVKKAATRKTAARKAAAKKTAAKKTAARKVAPRKATAKKATAKKAARKTVAKQVAAKKPAAKKPVAKKAASRKPSPRPRAARGITPAQALANTRKLLEAKQAHDREPAPWQALEDGHATPAHAGFQDEQAREQANALHAGESRMEAIQGANSTQDRHNQGKRDKR